MKSGDAGIFRVYYSLKGVLSSELVDQEQNKTNGNQQKTRLEASKPPTVFATDLSNLFPITKF